MNACLQVEQLKNSLYSIVCAVKAGVCIVGVVTTFWALKKDGITWLVHPNTKLLFIVHVVSTICLSVFCLIAYGFELYRFYIPAYHPCERTISEKTAFLIKIPAAFGSAIQTYTMAAFAIERTISTASPQSYEKKEKSRLGPVLTTVFILLAIATTGIALVSPNTTFEENTAFLSVKTHFNSTYFEIWMGTMVVSGILSLLLMVFNYFVSNKRSRRRISTFALNTKYQNRQNVTVCKILIPCFGFHLAFMLLPYVFMIVYTIIVQPTPDQIAIMAEYTNWSSVYGLIMPTIWLLRQKVKRPNSAELNKTMASNQYFEELRRQWNE